MSEALLLVADTALPIATVGLCRGERVLACRHLESKRDHAERIMSCVGEVLAESRLDLQDVDALVVGRGPGSFIGVRIAVSTFKGLALGLGCPIVGVSTAEALALSSPQGSPLAIAIDAKKGQVYAAAYRRDGHRLHELLHPTALAPDEAARRFAELHCATGLGDGFARYEMWGSTLTQADARIEPQALARLALPRIDAGDSDKLDSLVPDYVRRSEAEIKRGL